MSPWTSPDGTFHEIYSAAVFVGSRFLGSFLYDSGRDDLRWRRTGFSFFCPQCGQIWAAFVVRYGNDTQADFEVVPTSCATHGGGSVLQGQLENLLADLPPAMIEREFHLELKRVEKELGR